MSLILINIVTCFVIHSISARASTWTNTNTKNNRLTMRRENKSKDTNTHTFKDLLVNV